jgi:hypothetical protein
MLDVVTRGGAVCATLKAVNIDKVGKTAARIIEVSLGNKRENGTRVSAMLNMI